MAKSKTYEPRCVNHKERKTLPRLCHTCQRIAAEHEIAEKTVDALLGAGYSLNTDYGDGPVLGSATDSRGVILGAMFQGDIDSLMVFRGLDEVGWVEFVYGNSGYDVIHDYTTNFEELLAPILAFAETLS